MYNISFVRLTHVRTKENILAIFVFRSLHINSVTIFPQQSFRFTHKTWSGR